MKNLKSKNNHKEENPLHPFCFIYIYKKKNLFIFKAGSPIVFTNCTRHGALHYKIFLVTYS